MTFARWTPELAVGVNAVDEQHKELFEAVNALHDAMQAGKGREELGRALRFLRQYVMDHFKAEESIMVASAYPGYPKHRHAHEDLTAKVAELDAKFSRGAAMLSIEVLHFLRDWLVQHIQGEDRALGAWIRIHGLS